MSGEKHTMKDSIAEVKRLRLNDNPLYVKLQNRLRKIGSAKHDIEREIRRFETDPAYVGDEEYYVYGWRIFNNNDHK